MKLGPIVAELMVLASMDTKELLQLASARVGSATGLRNTVAAGEYRSSATGLRLRLTVLLEGSRPPPGLSSCSGVSETGNKQSLSGAMLFKGTW